MNLKITVFSTACDTDYGGEQTIEVKKGEFLLNEIFRLPFFRLIIDDIIFNSVCFRLMEGGLPHYFVLDEKENRAVFHRNTSIGEDNFIFELCGDGL